MGSFTAQILVGQAHPYQGGIIPSHLLFLSENSRPAWVLTMLDSASNEEKITWIPTVENMLQDALLMISVYVLKNQKIRSAPEIKKILKKDFIELYDDIGEKSLQELYNKCLNIDFHCKLVVVTFEGSTIRGQLKVLQDYEMDLEVCTPVYSRFYSEWKNSIQIEGSLQD